MGFFKRLLGLEEAGISDEIRAARARHGIEVEDPEITEAKAHLEKDQEKEDYDPWDEVRNMRANFFFGSWATRRYRQVVRNDDKLKEDLDKVARDREEKERLKAERKRQKEENSGN